MKYIQLKLSIEPFSETISEILTAGLAEIGFEGFQEEDPFLLAFIREDAFRRENLDRYLGTLDTGKTKVRLYPIGHRGEELE